MKNEFYITRSINKDQDYLIHLFLDTKISSENLYIGKIPKKHLTFEDVHSIFKDIAEYFSTKAYTIHLGDDESYTQTVENFPKLCWLTEEYFAGTLKNPVGVHYNPRINQNVIHPGGTRQRVINLWHNEETVQAIYFNTGGKQFDWLEDLSLVDILDVVKPGTFLAIVPDHGSLIPHIHYDQHLIPNNVRLYQNQISNFTKNIPRVGFSVENEFLKTHFPNAEESIDPTIIVDFKNTTPLNPEILPETIVKALIMIFLQYEVTSQEFDIRFVGRTPRKVLKI